MSGQCLVVMQVLVADDEITSQVMVETMLREKGHTVRNCDDGFDVAKVLSSAPHPRIAVISNSLSRLRGLDVSRFLCATGKKGGVYILLVSDVLDMELVDLCRRAGVDDIIARPFSAAAFASRLEAAERAVELEDELARVQGILHGLAAFESPVEKKARALRDANASLLGIGGKKSETEEPASKKTAATVSTAPKTHARPPVPSGVDKRARAFRGVQVFPEEDAGAASAQANMPAGAHSLMGFEPPPVKPVYAEPPASPVQGDSRPYSFEPPPQRAAPEQREETSQDVLENAQQVQDEELADEEIIHPFEFDEIILNVFSGMGVTLKSEIPPKPLTPGPMYASWVGVAIPTQTIWMDVMLVAGEQAGKIVTKELLGQSKATDADVCEMFSELQNMVQGSLRRYLEENGHKPVLQLTIPRASRREEALELPMESALVESGFSINGEPLMAILFEHREGYTCDKVMDMLCYDFVCEAVKIEGTSDELLVQGTLIRAKEKGVIEGFTGRVLPFRAMHVSPLAKAIGPSRLLELPGSTECCDVVVAAGK